MTGELNSDEIAEIIRVVDANPQLRMANVMTMLSISKSKSRTILKVTPIRGGIIIRGDRETGLNHIVERHGFFSTRQDWKNESSLDNPSKFPPNTMPILHYVEIIDELLDEEFKKLEVNKRPEKFDVYEKELLSSQGKKEIFRLITYKDTPLVHSLFPLKGIRKKVINLERGNSEGKVTFDKEAWMVCAVPYKTSKGDVIYSFQVLTNLSSKKEFGLLINHVNDTTYALYERKVELVYTLSKAVENLDMSDLSKVEKIMKNEYNKMKDSKD